MQDSRFRRPAADDNLDSPSSGLLAQPDRLALWAFLLAIVAMIAGAASAHAESSGGISGSPGPSGGATATPPSNAEALDWLMQKATWYGPGFFGNETACGKTLTRSTVGVAHRTLPCGTKVVLNYNGRYLRTKVVDRGPFANGAKWDLTQAAARELGFEVTDRIRVAKLARETG